MMTQPLLIEFLTEELPPKNLLLLSQVFTDTIVGALIKAGLCDASAEVKRYATPRRLGLKVSAVAALQEDRVVDKKGPAVSACYDAQGQPTTALIGFATSAGVDINALTKAMDGKREVVVARVLQKGQALSALLPAILDAAIKALPVAKNMRWQDLSEVFVRPVHRITLLHGSEILPYSRFGIQADRLTDGHRFLGKKNIVIPHADHYETLMANEGAVFADYAARREKIVAMLDAAVGNNGDRWQASPALVDEVCALTENPTVMVGHFDEAFLQVPQEALMVSMTQHQKYFPVVNADGTITARFLLVANMPSEAQKTIVQGNERVLRARLSDAQFFYQTDCKKTLAEHAQGLSQVTYLQALGTVGERVERIKTIAYALMPLLPNLKINAADIGRAAELCKADLVSGLVGEFPELQGVAGAYYARHSQENEAVATAIAEHYQPRFSGDKLPASDLGIVLALADKWELIAGLFGIGMRPTGDKDPFGLRRQALGIIRPLIEKRLPLDLAKIYTVLPQAFVSFEQKGLWKNPSADIHSFMMDRLRNDLRERGHSPFLVESVVAPLTHAQPTLISPIVLDTVLERIDAINAFVEKHKTSAENLVTMGKRLRNILRQSKESGGFTPVSLSEHLFKEPEEKVLFQAWQAACATMNAHIKARDFLSALMGLLTLEQPLAQFFEKIMVNTEDPAIRSLRLSLLTQLDVDMNQVGDLAQWRV